MMDQVLIIIGAITIALVVCAVVFLTGYGLHALMEDKQWI